MLTHRRIWHAIDRVAVQNDLSPSGLAKLAGLDPTAFNKSKRMGRDGRERWPSTESIAKVLAATGTGVDDFMRILGDTPEGQGQLVPLIGFAQAGAGGFFDDAGFPAGGSWDEITFPGGNAEGVYALEVSGDSMQPLYRDGDMIIIAPGEQVRRGDRVVVRTTEGEVMAKVLKRRSTKSVELGSLNPIHEDRIVAADQLDWIARIVWASQ
ncbi:MAG: helix-turn-helix transcriptional regulator [Pseudomonadota bacterium]